MLNNTQVLDSFIKMAVQLKTITDTEIVEQMASVPGADFDEICNTLTKAGVQIIPGGEVSPDEGLEGVDTPESDWDGGSMDSLHMWAVSASDTEGGEGTFRHNDCWSEG